MAIGEGSGLGSGVGDKLSMAGAFVVGFSDKDPAALNDTISGKFPSGTAVAFGSGYSSCGGAGTAIAGQIVGPGVGVCPPAQPESAASPRADRSACGGNRDIAALSRLLVQWMRLIWAIHYPFGLILLGL